MKKLFSLLLALVMVGSFSIPAFAAADPALIDTTRTGSISLYKYDVTGAEKDGVWDSSYVSTGIRDESGVEAIVLRGDRLRKYFPDVSMTPLAIENSIYDALEERRQRQAKEKAKANIFKGKKEPVK